MRLPLWQSFSAGRFPRRFFSANAEAKTKDSTVEESSESSSTNSESSEPDAEAAGRAGEAEESETKAEAKDQAAGKDGYAKAEEKAAEKPELSPAEKLQQELEDFTKKAAEKQHQVLLKLAEFENEKKKNQKILKQRETLVLSGFAREMVAVYEELDEVTKLGQSEDPIECVETLREGVVLTRDIFLKTLEKFGCERQIAERGSPYSSLEQESIKEVEMADLPADAVAEVLTPGWSFDSKVLQKAKVAVVQSGPPTPPAPPDTQDTKEEAPSDTKESS